MIIKHLQASKEIMPQVRSNLKTTPKLMALLIGSFVVFLTLIGEFTFADDRLYFIHRTNTFPFPEMKVGGVRYFPLDLKTPIAAEIPYRMTLHWSMGAIKPNHVLNLGEGQVVDAASSINKYIVIESFARLSDRIVGGWLDDLFIIGPYTLSPDSTLILPTSEAKRPELKDFQGHLVPYAEGSSGDEALRSLIAAKQVEIRFFAYFVGDVENSRLMALLKAFGTSGQALIETLRNMKSGQSIHPTITWKDKDSEAEIMISKMQSDDTFGYLYEEPTNYFGRTLCTHYDKELTNSPMTTLIFVSSLKDANTNAINLRDLFPNTPYLRYAYHSTNFGLLEDAIKDSKWDEVTRLLSLIRKSLVDMDVSVANFDKFVKSLEEATKHLTSLRY